MEKFRFAIMGAGNIAGKFCEAVSLLENCEVAAVASKSADRARRFAGKHAVAAYYDSYERMLGEEKPDCVYIAVTPNDHYALASLCLSHKTPVLCEKAFVTDSAQARDIFERSEAEGIFVMEALWSRFLPAVRQARKWMEEGRIGRPSLAEINIGFQAPADEKNRYFNRELGGGAAFDITVYAYELADFFLGDGIRRQQVAAVWGPTGVDVTDHVVLQYGDCMAHLTASFVAQLDEKAVIFGEKGRIVIPHPHYAGEAFYYPAEGGEVYFRDKETKNGFVYEIREVMECIRAGKTESAVVPHSLTLSCAELFDRIRETRPAVL